MSRPQVFTIVHVGFILLLLGIPGCGGGGGGGGGGRRIPPAKVIYTDFPVASLVFADVDRVYQSGRMVRIDAKPPAGAGRVVSGTIRINSSRTGYDSGTRPLTIDAATIFHHWDTTGREDAADYRVDVRLTDDLGDSYRSNEHVIRILHAFPTSNKLVSETDLAWSAPGGRQRFQRTYLLDSSLEGPLGYGWCHGFQLHVVEFPDGVTKVFNSDGSRTWYRLQPDRSYAPPRGERRVLSRAGDGTYTLESPAGPRAGFDASGRLTMLRDQSGNETRMVYDPEGRLVQVLDAGGRVTRLSWDGANRIASVEDPDARKVSYGYDGAGNLVRAVDAEGGVTLYTYDALHRLASVRDPAGVVTEYESDGERRLLSVAGAGGVGRIRMAYGDPRKDAMRVTDASGSTTTLTCDVTGAVVRAVDALGRSFSIAYDAEGEVVGVVDPAGGKSSITRDGRGNPTAFTDREGTTIGLAFDSATDLVTRVTDAAGNATRFSYDGSSRLIEERDPLSAVTRFEYDGAGNPEKRTDRMGREVRTEWDSAGRVTKRTLPGNVSDSWEYDPAGRLVKATNDRGTITHEYDSQGRLEHTVSAEGFEVRYFWGAGGRLAGIRYPSGMDLAYEYDPTGRLTTIRRNGSVLCQYGWNVANRMVSRTLANGVSAAWEYDAVGRLTGVVNRTPSGSVLSSFDYTYDALGNRISMDTTAGQATYDYSAGSRLTGAELPDGRKFAWVYDAAGNRKSETVDGAETKYETGPGNRYTKVGGDTLTHDRNGNLTGRSNASESTSYEYDALDRLVRVVGPKGTVGFGYDPFGRRVAKTTAAGTTHYVWDGLRVIAEADGGGTITAEYVYGLDIDEVLLMSRGGQDSYYSHDGLGSVTDLTDGQGKLRESCTYTPFGAPDQASVFGNPYLFTGRRYDPETGLYYYRARHYDPALGRFLTEDPIGLAGGQNLRAYVSDQPLSTRDPMGLQGLYHVPTFYNEGEALEWHFRMSGISARDIERVFTRYLIFQVRVYVYLLDLYSFVDPRVPDGLTAPLHWVLDWLEDGPPGPTEPPPEPVRPIFSADPSFVQPTSGTGEAAAQGGRCDISIPSEGALVRGSVPIFGEVGWSGAESYRLEVGEGRAPVRWERLATGTAPRAGTGPDPRLLEAGDQTIVGNLGNWDTGLTNYVYLPQYPADHPVDLHGVYTLRLVVTGEDGETVEDRVTVEVGHVVSNAWGGFAESGDGIVRLDVPDHAVTDSFRVVAIRPADAAEGPDRTGLLSGIYICREPGEEFVRPARLTFRTEAAGACAIGAWDPERGAWVPLKTRRSGEGEVSAPISGLAPFYALLPSEPAPVAVAVSAASATAGPGPVHDSFERGPGEWMTRCGRFGADLRIDEGGGPDGSDCLTVVNPREGGGLAVSVHRTPMDVRDHPVVSFDYRIGPDAKTDLYFRVAGRWYRVGFTDDPQDLDLRRVNIAPIGRIEDVRADGEWHTAQFDLREMLRTKTARTRVDEIVMGDFDVTGYMKLEFGANPAGATFSIDDFTVGAATGGPAEPASEDIFTDGKLGRVDASREGTALGLTFEVEEQGAFAGYVMAPPATDLREELTLSLKIRGLDGDLLVGLRDAEGHQSVTTVTPYLPPPDADLWRRVEIPLVRFREIRRWDAVDAVILSASSEYRPRGRVLVDEVCFKRTGPGLAIDDFESSDGTNRLGGAGRTLASAAATIRARRLESGGEGVLGVSYGGDIGHATPYDPGLGYCLWSTDTGGIDARPWRWLSIRVRGSEGSEKPNLYLHDGTFRWGLDLSRYGRIDREWRTIRIPLEAFEQAGVDTSHLAEIQVVFEWEKMSGTVYLDDLRFEGER